MKRREFIAACTVVGLAPNVALASRVFPVRYSLPQWRERLGPVSFRVMRLRQDEAAFSSPLHDETAPGTYVCRGCEQPLFGSARKLETDLGWPIFTQPIRKGAIGRSTRAGLSNDSADRHCTNCGSYLGQLVEDRGRNPDCYLRINGAALEFRATSAATGASASSGSVAALTVAVAAANSEIGPTGFTNRAEYVPPVIREHGGFGGGGRFVGGGDSSGTPSARGPTGGIIDQIREAQDSFS